jgi:hypothetical protein
MTETSHFFHPPLKKYKLKYLFSIRAWANVALKWSAANIGMEWSLLSAFGGLGNGTGKAGAGGMKSGRVERNGMKGLLLPCGDQRLFSRTAELATGSVRYERVKGAIEAVRGMCRGAWGKP